MVNLNLGRVAPHVQAAAEEISRTFGIYNIGGFRLTGSVADSDHPKGLAIDVPATGDKGDSIASWVIQNSARLGVTYVIWDRHIWQNDTWKNYSGPSPHTDHVHISFSATGSSEVPVGNSSSKGCLGNLLPTAATQTFTLLEGIYLYSFLKWGTLCFAILVAAKQR